jgi:hypothetical protein
MVVPINVAVVPHGDPTIEGDDAINDLTRVTAALQIQVTRDFAPIWGVSANVTPFFSLDHVPVGYMALVLAARPPIKTHGVHYAAGGRPFALVKYENLKHPGNWSVTASHELLEMLSDPWGTRVMPGRALTAKDDSTEQVEYLLEVCDPCQTSTYLIDGVLVSDFVTPDFYSPKETVGLRYSFTGDVKKPRTVLKDGYITWRIPGSEEIWQQHGPLTDDNPPKQLGRLSLLSALSPRESVDSADTPAPSLYDEDFPDPKRMDEARKAYDAATAAAQRYGRALRRDIGTLLPLAPPVGQSGPAPLTFLDIFEALGDERFHAEYLRDPRGAIDNLVTETGRELSTDIVVEQDIPATIDDPDDLAPPAVFKWHAEQLTKKPQDDRDFGDPVFLPGGALWWLAALGGG